MIAQFPFAIKFLSVDRNLQSGPCLVNENVMTPAKERHENRFRILYKVELIFSEILYRISVLQCTSNISA